MIHSYVEQENPKAKSLLFEILELLQEDCITAAKVSIYLRRSTALLSLSFAVCTAVSISEPLLKHFGLFGQRRNNAKSAQQQYDDRIITKH